MNPIAIAAEIREAALVPFGYKVTISAPVSIFEFDDGTEYVEYQWRSSSVVDGEEHRDGDVLVRVVNGSTMNIAVNVNEPF